MCHLLLFAPVLALPVFWLLPMPLAIPLYLAVVGSTGLLLWPGIGALRQPQRAGREGMVGARGEALTEINPRGLVQCQGEIWEAAAAERISTGERVRVLAVDRLRLRVSRPTLGRNLQEHTACHDR